MKQEKKIINLLSKGYTAGEIGEKLKLSRRTIEKQIEILKMIYKAKNVAHLVAIKLTEKFNK